MKTYPEHDKLASLTGHLELLIDFVGQMLPDHVYEHHGYDDYSEIKVEDMVYTYLGIDQARLEVERKQMVQDYMRLAQERVTVGDTSES